MSDNSVDVSFNFANVDENKQTQIALAREAFKKLADLMCRLCDDKDSYRFNNGYARLQEAKFWFTEAMCKD